MKKRTRKRLLNRAKLTVDALVALGELLMLLYQVCQL
jgi:hypothetical protein